MDADADELHATNASVHATVSVVCAGRMASNLKETVLSDNWFNFKQCGLHRSVESTSKRQSSVYFNPFNSVHNIEKWPNNVHTTRVSKCVLIFLSTLCMERLSSMVLSYRKII